MPVAIGSAAPPAYMAKRIRVIDSDGQPSWMKKNRARQHAAAGRGEFQGDTFHFHRRAPLSPPLAQANANRLAPPDITDVIVPFSCSEPVAIQCGFLRYPQPNQASAGGKFPGIAAFR